MVLWRSNIYNRNDRVYDGITMICQKHLARVKDNLLGALEELETFRKEAMPLDSSKTGFGTDDIKADLNMTYRMIEGLDSVLKIMQKDHYR